MGADADLNLAITALSRRLRPRFRQNLGGAQDYCPTTACSKPRAATRRTPALPPNRGQDDESERRGAEARSVVHPQARPRG
jgi:hypothetical protein